MTRLRVLRCSTYPAVAVELLRAALTGHDLVCCAEHEVLDHAPTADVLIPARARITSAVLDAAPRCRLIQQGGAGVDSIDLVAAAARGLPVANVPAEVSRMAEAVAELAVFHVVGLVRQVPALMNAVRAGDWQAAPISPSVWDKTVGVVGLGAIGRAIVRLLRPYGCRLLGLKRRPDEALRQALGLEWLGGQSDLGALLNQADVLVLSVPLTAATRGLIGAAELAQMRPGSYLVNVSRGPVVDEAALLSALASGRLAGAGLDVFWDEPADPAHPIVKYPVIITPHVAGYTTSVLQRSSAVVAENLRRLVTGEPVLYRVN
jgi:phosphoglycerate dehydrogenase-like enzyme